MDEQLMYDALEDHKKSPTALWAVNLACRAAEIKLAQLPPEFVRQ